MYMCVVLHTHSDLFFYEANNIRDCQNYFKRANNLESKLGLVLSSLSRSLLEVGSSGVRSSGILRLSHLFDVLVLDLLHSMVPC